MPRFSKYVMWQSRLYSVVRLRSWDGAAILIIEYLLGIFVRTKKQEDQAERPQVCVGFQSTQRIRNQVKQWPPDVERKKKRLSLLSQKKPDWQLAHEVTLLYYFKLLSFRGLWQKTWRITSHQCPDKTQHSYHDPHPQWLWMTSLRLHRQHLP